MRQCGGSFYLTPGNPPCHGAKEHDDDLPRHHRRSTRQGALVNFEIPDHWTGDEALTFVAFLEEVILAVWGIHGHDMAAQLRRAEEQSTLGYYRCPPALNPLHVPEPPDDPRADDEPGDDDLDNDIPF